MGDGVGLPITVLGLCTIRVMKIPGSEFSSVNWIIDIVYVGTWIGNGVVYGPIYGNM